MMGSRTHLRIADPALRPAPEIAFRFDGRTLSAYQGETIAAALAANGIADLGRRRDGTPRGVWCGMGVCQECVVIVDGRPSERACMTTVTDGMVVRTQEYATDVSASGESRVSSPPAMHRPQVLVVGAGPAGMSVRHGRMAAW